MIGLDTNVVIRFLTQDDPIQSPIANDLIENTLSQSNLGFITLVSLIEIVWVLESCYDQNKATLCQIIEQLLSIKQIKVERADLAHQALKSYKKASADFSDAVIAITSEHEGCNKTFTFDKKAKSIGMELLGA